jgi:hypothetical protein
VTADEFRDLALELPEAVENEHMGHPDFRVRKKIFATLSSAGEDWAMVKLTPELQQTFVKTEPRVYEPFPGAWGARGCTKVHLARAKEESVRQALVVAWRNTAPKKMVMQFDAR